MKFTSKVVIVTGSSTGIGAAAAVMFCKEGASVVIVGRDYAKLKKTSAECAKVGGKHIIVKADVSIDEDAKRIIDETLKYFNKIDILVNNAGVFVVGTIMDGTVLDSYDKIMNINLRAVVNLTMLAAPHLVKTKGNIINISSIGAKVNKVPISIAYNASKAALDSFTRSTAFELSKFGVRVNIVSPGPVQTDMMARITNDAAFDPTVLKSPLDRVTMPEEIAELILFLASESARGITGSTYVSDNGWLLA